MTTFISRHIMWSTLWDHIMKNIVRLIIQDTNIKVNYGLKIHGDYS